MIPPLPAIAALAVASTALAGPPALTTELITDGLSSPTFMTHAPGDFDRLFVIERAGFVRVIRDGVLLAEPLLDIEDLVSTSFEGGLLGIAFHPDHMDNGRFFVHYTIPGAPKFSLISIVEEYTIGAADPDVADPATARRILQVGQPASNHNGGWIGFHPLDGTLFIAYGDGGFSGSGRERSQDITDQPLGKMLRIDVNGDDFPADPDRNYAVPLDNPFRLIEGDDEIWAYGLRNPWRSGFDRETGDLWIGDVGAAVWEEIDFEPATAGGGLNYGWGCMEAHACNGVECHCNDPGLVLPVHAYDHITGCAVTGGVVYRGCAIPELAGTYFFGDYCAGRIWSFRYDGATMTEFQERTAELEPAGPPSIQNVVAFGEDAWGEIYICDMTGDLFKIVPAIAPPDANGNGIPDTCENIEPIPGDIDGDGDIDFADLLVILANWGPCIDCPADIDENGVVGLSDLLILLSAWT